MLFLSINRISPPNIFTFYNTNVTIVNIYKFFMSISRDNHKTIGRPEITAFMILVGTYITTGQLIPGVSNG